MDCLKFNKAYLLCCKVLWSQKIGVLRKNNAKYMLFKQILKAGYPKEDEIYH